MRPASGCSPSRPYLTAALSVRAATRDRTCCNTPTPFRLLVRRWPRRVTDAAPHEEAEAEHAPCQGQEDRLLVAECHAAGRGSPATAIPGRSSHSSPSIHREAGAEATALRGGKSSWISTAFDASSKAAKRGAATCARRPGHGGGGCRRTSTGRASECRQHLLREFGSTVAGRMPYDRRRCALRCEHQQHQPHLCRAQQTLHGHDGRHHDAARPQRRPLLPFAGVPPAARDRRRRESSASRPG
jgi:hypothetical protein